MSDNMSIYNATRAVPQDAQKTIQAGRLKGKTDINPMWRIKTLTGRFGPCGFGWRYVITKQWLEEGDSGEIAAFCNIDLFVKVGGEWSDAIPGTGGSAFVAAEKNGLYTSDECFKMALTDAISVACKALGFAADIYWVDDRTKYGHLQESARTNVAASRKKAEPAPAQPYQPMEEEREMKYVAAHARGEKTPNGRDMITAWAQATHAGPKERAEFISKVENYKINNNLK